MFGLFNSPHLQKLKPYDCKTNYKSGSYLHWKCPWLGHCMHEAMASNVWLFAWNIPINSHLNFLGLTCFLISSLIIFAFLHTALFTSNVSDILIMGLWDILWHFQVETKRWGELYISILNVSLREEIHYVLDFISCWVFLLWLVINSHPNLLTPTLLLFNPPQPLT